MGREIGGEEMIDRAYILDTAKTVVTGEREEMYGTPEDSFRLIGQLWESYLLEKCVSGFNLIVSVEPEDVAIMMALLKVARIALALSHIDSWVDLAGYAACGGEIAMIGEENRK